MGVLLFRRETAPMPEAGVKEAELRLIWKKSTVTPLGGSSVTLRLTWDVDVEFTVGGVTAD